MLSKARSNAPPPSLRKRAAWSATIATPASHACEPPKLGGCRKGAPWSKPPISPACARPECRKNEDCLCWPVRPGNCLSDPQHAPKPIDLLKEAVALHQGGEAGGSRVLVPKHPRGQAKPCARAAPARDPPPPAG